MDFGYSPPFVVCSIKEYTTVSEKYVSICK